MRFIEIQEGDKRSLFQLTQMVNVFGDNEESVIIWVSIGEKCRSYRINELYDNVIHQISDPKQTIIKFSCLKES